MKTISTRELQLHAWKIVSSLKRGQRITVTVHGQPVAQLEPIVDDKIDADDPFFTLGDLSDPSGPSLTNPEIDSILYRD